MKKWFVYVVLILSVWGGQHALVAQEDSARHITVREGLVVPADFVPHSPAKAFEITTFQCEKNCREYTLKLKKTARQVCVEELLDTQNAVIAREAYAADVLLVNVTSVADANALRRWAKSQRLVLKSVLDSHVYHLTLPTAGKKSLDDYAKSLKQVNAAFNVSRNYVMELCVDTRYEPNDPYVIQQWALDQISAGMAWTIRKNASGVKIAIIDTGCKLKHNDLKLNFGYDAVYETEGTVNDFLGHGTHCAGIVSAIGNNLTGVCGVAPESETASVCVLDDDGYIYHDYLVSAIAWCINKKIDVINCSLGSESSSTALESAFGRLHNAGIMVAVAAGNANLNLEKTPYYPASYALKYDNIVCVGASDIKDQRASFSNYGVQTVGIFAPGVNIASTYNRSTNDYTFLNGTSMATPCVVGVLALMRAEYPTASYAELIQKLYDSGDPIEGLKKYCRSGKRVNLARALGADTSSVIPVTDAQFSLNFPVMPIEKFPYPIADPESIQDPAYTSFVFYVKDSIVAKNISFSVTLNHSSGSDFEICCIAPSGGSFNLKDASRSSNSVKIQNLIWATDGHISCPANALTGYYNAKDSARFSAWRGKNIRGFWTFYIVDTLPGKTGKITDLSFKITTDSGADFIYIMSPGNNQKFNMENQQVTIPIDYYAWSEMPAEIVLQNSKLRYTQSLGDTTLYAGKNTLALPLKGFEWAQKGFVLKLVQKRPNGESGVVGESGLFDILNSDKSLKTQKISLSKLELFVAMNQKGKLSASAPGGVNYILQDSTFFTIDSKGVIIPKAVGFARVKITGNPTDKYAPPLPCEVLVHIYERRTTPPKITAITGTSPIFRAQPNGVSLCWELSKNTSEGPFFIRRSESKKIAENDYIIGPLNATSRTYRDHTAIPGKLYYYRIAVASSEKGGFSAWSKPVSGHCALAPCSLIASSNEPYEIGVHWIPSNGARYFMLQRSNGKAASRTSTLLKWKPAIAYSDLNWRYDLSYFYNVVCSNDPKGKIKSASSNVAMGTLQNPWKSYYSVTSGDYLPLFTKFILDSEASALRFTAKPTLTARYTDPFTNKSKKMSLTPFLTERGAWKDLAPDSVMAEVRTPPVIYNKKDFRLGTRYSYTTYEILHTDYIAPNYDLVADLWTKGTFSKKKIDAPSGYQLYYFAPMFNTISVDSVDSPFYVDSRYTVTPQSVLTLQGYFFGNQKPKIYVEYYSAANEKLTVLRVPAKQVKLQKYLFRNGKEKESPSNPWTGDGYVQIDLYGMISEAMREEMNALPHESNRYEFCLRFETSYSVESVRLTTHK